MFLQSTHNECIWLVVLGRRALRQNLSPTSFNSIPVYEITKAARNLLEACYNLLALLLVLFLTRFQPAVLTRFPPTRFPPAAPAKTKH
jgi:hypothetical protein